MIPNYNSTLIVLKDIFIILFINEVVLIFVEVNFFIYPILCTQYYSMLNIHPTSLIIIPDTTIF